MKIYCERCKKEDISEDVDKMFEKIILGRIKCPKCNYLQNRFICEADILLYMGICEVAYFFLTIIATYVYENMIKMWWLTIIFVVLLAIVALSQKQIGRFIYSKELIKIDMKRQVDEEANAKIRKELNTLFMVYFLMAVCSILSPNYRIDFIIGLVILTIITFVKFYVTLSNEKKNSNS